MPKGTSDLSISVLEQTGALLWPKIFNDRWQYSDNDNWPGKYEQSYAYIDWLSKVDTSKLKKIFLVHGEEESQDVLKEKIETEKPIRRMLKNIIAVLFAPSFCEIILIGFMLLRICAIFVVFAFSLCILYKD